MDEGANSRRKNTLRLYMLQNLTTTSEFNEFNNSNTRGNFKLKLAWLAEVADTEWKRQKENNTFRKLRARIGNRETKLEILEYVKF